MLSTDATRLLLFADGPRAARTQNTGKIRHYRLARLRLDGSSRGRDVPRDEALKRPHS